MKKRFFSLALALCMVLSMLPFGASAADIVDQGTCGDGVSWKLDSTGKLTITGTGAMTTHPWSASEVKSASISAGVSSICSYAFSGCSNMASISISSSGSKLKTIGNSAFSSCSSLKTISIPTTVTSIGSYAFNYCSSLTSVSGLGNVTSLGNSAFQNCTSLKTVAIPSKLTSVPSHMLYGCSSVTSISIPAGVTKIGDNSFLGTGLTTVTIPSGVTSIEAGAFADCAALTKVTISSSVTSIGGAAFANCSKLETISVMDNNPAFTVSNGILYNKAKTELISCPGGKSGAVTIPSSVTSILGSAFNGCSLITSVSIPSGVTSIGPYAFSKCKAITAITLPDGITSIQNGTFSECSKLSSITIPEGVTSIGSGAFKDCAALQSVEIPPSVTKISEFAFQNCKSLKGVYIRDLTAWCGTVFSLNSGNPLSYAHNLYLNNQLVTDLVIPDNTTEIKQFAFESCTPLTSVTIPESVTKIGEEAFAWCTNLRSISVASENPAYDSEDGVLYNKEQTVLICCPAGKSGSVSVPSGVTCIGEDAFQGCDNITNVILPNGVTSIEQDAFYDSNLSGLVIPSSVTTIGYRAFYYCYFLKDVWFTGSEADWAAVSIQNANEYLQRATKHLDTQLPLMTAQPQDVNSVVGETATFSVEALGTGLTYLWQFSDDEGQTWTDTEETSAELSVEIAWAMNGRQYRCVVTDTYGESTESEPATLTAACVHTDGFESEIRNDAEPTCTEPGYTGDVYCLVCGELVTQGEEIPALGHETELKNAKEPTCAEPGYTGDQVCTRCGETIVQGEAIPAPGHETELKNDKEPTCTEPGYTGDGVCTRCGETVRQGEAIPALGHETELKDAKEPTCTEPGYSGDEICTRCGETVAEGEEIPALGHEPELRNAKEPTCSAPGYTSDLICARCGELLEQGEEIPPLPHKTQLQNAKDATCTEYGYTGDEVCVVCAETVKQGVLIPKLPHETVLQNAKEVTCTEPGYTGDEICTVCGEILKQGETIPAPGHEIERQNAADPTCTEPGYYGDDVCTVCGETLAWGYELPALGHESELRGAVSADCTHDGYTGDSYCARCGELLQQGETIAAPGHQTTLSGAKDPTCTEPGHTYDLVCTVCGEIIEPGEDIPKLPHETERRNEKAPTCTETGYTGDLVCTVCGEIVESGDAIPMIEHTWGDWIVIRHATEDAEGMAAHVCDVCGKTETSVIPKVVVPFEILEQPADQTATAGDQVQFTVQATGKDLTYQWQYQLAGKTAWNNSGMTGAKTDTLTVSATTARDGQKYRCRITNADGEVLYSDPAKLSVKPALTITAHPADAEVEGSNTADFTVAATGAGLKYRWQFKTANGSVWNNCSSATRGYNTATLTVVGMSGGTNRNGYRYRCVVTDESGNTCTSNAAVLTVRSVFAITAHPQDVTASPGSVATFTVAAEGSGLTYQWQYKIVNGSVWNNCTSATKGYNAATVQISAEPKRSGYQYRCLVTDASGRSLASDTAFLKVASAISITAQPKNITAVPGDTVKFTVEASGNDLTYQWQYCLPGKTVWNNSGMTGATTATLHVPATAARSGQQYRCVVKNAAGRAVSSPAMLMVSASAKPMFMSEPQSVTAQAGAKVTFSVEATGGSNLQYQWQYLQPGKTTWYNSTLSGAKTPVLTVSATAARNGQQYRCVVRNANGAVTSEPAMLSVK